jgi:hypothetical protein
MLNCTRHTVLPAHRGGGTGRAVCAPCPGAKVTAQSAIDMIEAAWRRGRGRVDTYKQQAGGTIMEETYMCDPQTARTADVYRERVTELRRARSLHANECVSSRL